MRHYLYIVLGLLLLTGCEDNKPSEPELGSEHESEIEKTDLSKQERADNPLLKLQDDTTTRAEDAVKDAMEKQQQALDNIDK